MASLRAVVVLFCVPFGLPVWIRLANCAGDAISDMALLSIEHEASFPFLPVRTFCAFPTCHPPQLAPTLHQACVTQAKLKPDKPMKTSTFLLLMLTLINADILALAMLPLTTPEALAVSVVCLGTMLATIKTAFAR